MSKYYIPLHNHSEFSLKDGISKIKYMPDRLKEIDCPGMSLTDHGSLASSVAFYKTLKKQDVQPIIGIEQYVSRQDCAIKSTDNRKLDHLLILCKNTAGWKSLLNLVYDANLPEHFYHNMRIDVDKLPQYTQDGNLIGICGHLGSILASKIVIDDVIQQDWQKDGIACAKLLEEMFGKGNFYLEVQLVNNETHPVVAQLAECIRTISQITKIPTVATGDSHYLRKPDSVLQNIMLCDNLNMKMQDGPTSGMSAFFKTNNFHIPSYDEMLEFGNTEEELDRTLEVAAQCEDYDILHQPKIPKYNCPTGHDESTWLRQQCWDGWQKKIEGKIPQDRRQEYADRVKYELQVLQEANLAGYFLTVKDIVDYGRTIGLMGAARGSVAGSLVSYLLNITQVDSIKHSLIFERFYNKGRATKGHVSLPDIDIDCPQNKRGKILEYIANRFGHDQTCQVAAYSSLKGRNAIKSVLRGYGDVSFNEMNEITKQFPDAAKISAELHEQEDRDLESSIIRYVLENDKKQVLKDWCYIDKEGNLQGRMSKRFGQAIALENTKTHRSTHPAGIVISPYLIRDSIPTVYDTKNKKSIAALEMGDLEDIGMVKFDLLGLATLDKLAGVKQILNTGFIQDD